MHTVVYRAHMEVSGQMLPTMVVADDSIYTMIQVRVAASVVNEGNNRLCWSIGGVLSTQ